MLARQASQAGKTVDPIAKVRQLIRRKSSERDRLQKEIAQCDAALLPLQQHQRAMAELDREIHELFGALLMNPKLAKRAQREVRGVYESLQVDQIISPDPAWARERANACTCQACSPSDDFSELRVNELGADEPGQRRAEHESQRPQPPEREASVRTLYHKLALRYHPDRAVDDQRRAEHEAVMRDVNDAYHAGDTERLLTLSRELGIDLGDLQGSDGVLAELVRQYERVKAEVRELRNSPVGTLVAEMRRARQRGYRSPIEGLNEQAETALRDLTEVRDFVRDFAEGKISLKTFLRGPQLDTSLEVADTDELFLELLDMVEQVERSVRRSNPSTRRKNATR